MTSLPCPACGFQTLERGYCSYDICPLCDWEDDGVQLANPTSGGGANRASLAQAQAAALEKLPLELGIAQGYRRGLGWRPLSEEEIMAFDALKTKSHWHAKAILEEQQAYWAANTLK
ncbi:MAG TPA: CPCC family cysteine-rich protein [Luteimonas sp.]|nr:CPCC family cysteine-rich protein [Luteimonas sp.]